MKTFFSAILFLLVVIQILEAAPRRRGRARRQAQQYTRTTTNNQTTVTTQPQYYQQAVQTQQYPTIQSQQYQSQPVQQATYTVASASPNELPSVPLVENEVALSPSPATVVQASFQQQVLPTSNTVSNAGSSGSAIAEANAIRARRGLPAFIEDPALSAVAYQKASIQANRGAMYHPGGSMGGARYEGVGMGNQFTTCYLYTNAGRTAGAATVRGRNGQRFHCLLVK